MIIADIFDKGGIVVWVLAGYSLIALTILLERMIHFGLMRGHSKKFEQQLVAALQQGTVEQLIEKMRGPEANILRGMMQASREGITDLGRVASRIGSIELQRMERGFRTLSILGNTAPLLGLLGTIIGMIKAFMVIEQAGGRVDAQALAGGIWEAMLTTGVGLVVAIPVLLLLHVLEGMADRRAQNMRSDASLLLEQLPHVSDGDQSEVVHHREGVLHAV
ncbi:MAG: MotA/TolQ/ExbB proton channel family protein [Gammaproteobacteria bacterium]|nr:MotA/TolQ/ExbB proton channel family protein [Gammaproteobacteria bacterium]